MDRQKEQLIADMVKKLNQMDMTGLLLVNTGVEVLRKKEQLDKADESKHQKTG